MLLLRPHHINCIFFYRGLGYSEDFILGMNNMLTLFKENPNTKIKLTIKCDNLCVKCPNKQLNNVCITEEMIARLDYNTLQIYNLKENKEYAFNEIIDIIYKNFNKDTFHKICSTCNWYKDGVCNDNIINEQLEKWTL